MNLTERITTDPEILGGKPVVKGTRLAVEFLLDLMAQGWTETEILRNYPGLTAADLAVCQSRSDWVGHFSVVEERRIRVRSLP